MTFQLIKLKYILLLPLIVVGFISCKNHATLELPQNPNSNSGGNSSLNPYLEVSFDISWQNILHKVEFSTKASYVERHRFIIEVAKENQIISRETKLITEDEFATGLLRYRLQKPLEATNYTISVWYDKLDDEGNPVFIVDDLNTVELNNFSTIDADALRCAFVCEELDLREYASSKDNKNMVKELTLNHPGARFEIIATDVQEFITLQKAALNQGDKFNVRLEFVSSYHNLFNVNQGKPVQNNQTLILSGWMRLPFDNYTELKIAEGFLFCKEEDVVNTVLSVVNNNSLITVSETDEFSFPVKRGHITTISGNFLTHQVDGIFNIDNGMFVDVDKIGNIEDGRLLILSTGSQGEPMSALTRMASGEFNKVQIGSNDTIVISANPIPGNERDVYTVINKLYRLGANVVYSALSAVHVSGHACQEDLKLIYTLVKPKYFIPVHGEYRHLKQHATLVENLKHKKSNVIIPDIGDCVELDNNTFKVVGQIASGSVMVDGLGVGDVGNAVLRDRLTLSEDGILVCVVGLNKRTSKLTNDIEIVSRGCFFQGDTENNPVDELKQEVKLELAKATNQGVGSISVIKSSIQRVIRHYFRVKWKRNPVVLPIILEV